MMNNLIEYKESIWKKFKINFGKFLNMFRKRTTIGENNSEQINIEKMEHKEEKNLFREQLQKDIKNEKTKEELLEKIDSNFDIIHTLPNERLDQISELYNEKINKVKARLEKKRLLLEKKRQLL